MTAVPDVAGPIRAWRLLAVTPLGELESVGYGATVWQPGVNTASCGHLDPSRPRRGDRLAAGRPDEHAQARRLGDHRAPDPRCECGFYAVTSPDAAAALCCHGELRRFHGVVAEVQLTGRVIRHEHGWRAEHAEVTRLHVPREAIAARLLYDVVRSYRIPVAPLHLPARCGCQHCTVWQDFADVATRAAGAAERAFDALMRERARRYRLISQAWAGLPLAMLLLAGLGLVSVPAAVPAAVGGAIASAMWARSARQTDPDRRKEV